MLCPSLSVNQNSTLPLQCAHSARLRVVSACSHIFCKDAQHACVAAQACTGLLQLMRENSAAGAAFCRLLVTQLQAGNDVMPIDSLLELSRLLLDHLLQVPISKGKGRKKATGKNGKTAQLAGALPATTNVPNYTCVCARACAQGLRPRQNVQVRIAEVQTVAEPSTSSRSA